MSALSYSKAAKEFVDQAQIPFLQGHRAAAGAIRALVDLQSAPSRRVAELDAHPARAKAIRLVRGLEGALDEEQGAALLELYGVKRPKEHVVQTPEQAAKAGRAIGGAVAVKALAPEIPHKAKLGGVRLGLKDPGEIAEAADEVLRAATRGGATSPKVIVQQMVSGREVLVGAVIDERFGACVTMRPGGAQAEDGEATFVPAPLTARQAQRYVEEQADRCGLREGEHDLRAVAKAVESIARAAHDLRVRLTSLEANPLLVGKRGAVAVDALAEARPPE
jgi:acetate---CoA ligase (ADP-forming)